jgi:response regulator NasT
MMLSDVEYAYSQEKKKKKREKERLRAAKKRSPEEQMILDNAKAYLMERNHLSEEEAFRYIQKNSMDMGRSMVETAQMILMF